MRRRIGALLPVVLLMGLATVPASATATADP